MTTIARTQSETTNEESAWLIYFNRRTEIEVEQNIGRFVTIDVESGDYEIGDDNVQTWREVKARQPQAVTFTLRVGYTSTFSRRGGGMMRLPR